MSDNAKPENAKADSPEQTQFRQHCRDWLTDNIPPPPPVRLPQGALEIMTQPQMDYLVDWQKAAYSAGLVGADYPVECGGGGRSNCQKIANQEMQRAGTPYFPNIIGLGMACPTVFHHGSDALKERLLPKLLSGEEIWCQGFSEPGAGSDLANTQTFCEKKGDKWIINGHKVWTSLAHFADWMILLARTSKDDKYTGLTYFVVPIKAALGKGVTVRPLIKITGQTGFNEVIFDDLEVDDSFRLDKVGAGWQVAMTTLLHERGAGELVTPKAGTGVKDDSKPKKNLSATGLVDLAKDVWRNGVRASDDPVMRDKIMQLIIRQEGSRQGARRASVQGLIDHPMRLPLQTKLVMSEINQDVTRTALEMEGVSGTLYMGDQNAPADAQWPLAYMNSFGGTIAAGTSEVQKNILGERVLGMPKSK